MADYRKYDNKEFDVDTGTYMEDVHSNDFIGIDKDGNVWQRKEPIKSKGNN